MRTVEEILREAKNRGLFLANLYERRTFPAHPNTPAKAIGEWRAAFSHAGGHRDEDIGPSAAEALEEALTRAKGLKGPENRPTPVAEAKPTPSLDDLI
jgi:hypothetical protein